jgi:ABC-type transport system involved in multi-copper enzyme maturation permease subunit
MRDLLHSEWKKIIRNYKLTTFLVGIYPIAAAALTSVLILPSLFSREFAGNAVAMSSGQWTTDALGVWSLVSSFPSSVMGRMLPLAFMAVVFADEYQRGTWKNLVPRTRRSALIMSKLAMLALVVSAALVSMSLILAVGNGLLHKVAGLPYGPSVTKESLASFCQDYARETLIGLVALLVLATFAALSALATRSVLGGLLAGFGFSVVDPISFLLLMLLGGLLERPSIIDLYRFTPSYNLDNARSWLVNQRALVGVGPGFTAEPSLAVSCALLAAWLVGLTALALWVFQRQDITS